VGVISGPVVCGGILHDAFGHLVAELTTRLPASLWERPDDLHPFMTGMGKSKPVLAPHILTLLEWFGLPTDQWRLVQSRLHAAELRVVPQAEQLWGPPPMDDHLALLDQTAWRNALVLIGQSLLYVSRIGIIRRGTGVHAGEVYHVERLRSLGISVLDPASAPLAEQLAAYDGAGTLIYAEGSAVHGRQLLGARDQRIVILNRRPSERLARTALTARVADLSYAEVTGKIMACVRSDGAIRFQKGLAFYDLDVLFAAFADVGVDLHADWDNEAYSRALLTDLDVWAAKMAAMRGSTDADATKERPIEALETVGLSAYAPAVISRIMHASI
jgi:hypothetical protein